MLTDLTPLWLSLKTAGAATVITFFSGIAIARWISFYQGKGKTFIDGLIILPMVLPPTVIGFILLIIFGKNGLIGQTLFKLGITIVFSWPAAVIAATVVSFPLMYKTTRGAFEQIDTRILDAARTLGLSEWRIFWKIMLPLSLPSLCAGLTLSFARALGEFGATLMLAGNIPGKTQTIPTAIYYAVESGDTEKAMMWVIIIVVISLIIVFSLNQWANIRNRYTYKSQGG